ncbi:MAG: hypothetical protein IJT94_15900, partial [Oscillibacter sp.]|nr:hypothetical protein [Oscillibacter sp.]
RPEPLRGVPLLELFVNAVIPHRIRIKAVGNTYQYSAVPSGQNIPHIHADTCGFTFDKVYLMIQLLKFLGCPPDKRCAENDGDSPQMLWLSRPYTDSGNVPS